MFKQVISCSLPKIGETEKNIQDRFAVSADNNLIAISDGAGSSLYPSQWAEILVEHFCHTSSEPIAIAQQSYEEWLQPAQEKWRQYYLERLTNPNRKWWQGGSQLKSHAAATFVGLKAVDELNSEQKRWQAIAVGDSCLFKLTKNTAELISFPLQKAEEFKGTTQCFFSLPEYSSFPPQFIEGVCEQGDIFLLATDALSQWLLTEYEQQSTLWQEIFTLDNSEEFIAFVEKLRREKSIKNDDITGLIVPIA
jgi:serine/threonine protein phosphatase PrpC